MTASVNVSCRIVESFRKKDDCIWMNYRKIPSTWKLATSVNNAMKPLPVGKTLKPDALLSTNASDALLCQLFSAVTLNKGQICKNMHHFYLDYI